MVPIRVGFLGLSEGGWARHAHFPYLDKSDDYQIVAICNSSVASSQNAIRLFGLPESTKAYGDPEDIAKDKDIDLVVCSVRVDRHLPTIAPALRAGKDVYVEWPLGRNLSEAKELLRLKNEGGVKNAFVGLQGREAPEIKKLKSIIKSGKIGEVLSSTWTAYAGQAQMGSFTVDIAKFMLSREIGGNLETIHFGHSVDYVQNVLGYGFKSTPNAILANRRPNLALLSIKGELVNPAFPKDTADTIFLQGTLSTGVPLSMTLRGGPPFPGVPGVDWHIYGSKGEIRFTAPAPLIQMGSAGVKIEVQNGEGGDVETVEVERDAFDDLAAGEKAGHFALAACNVGRLYAALKEGKLTSTFEDAVERHELIEGIQSANGLVS